MTVLQTSPRTATPNTPLRVLDPSRLGKKKKHKKKHKHHAVPHPVAHPPAPVTPAGPGEPSATTYPKTAVLDARSLHILSRFTGGWNGALGEQVTAAGGIDAWFAKQLSPELLPDAFYAGSSSWWSSNLADALTTVARRTAGTEEYWQVSAHYQTWSLVRRMFSERQVLETMAAFWEHHFHVPTDGSESTPYRADYGRIIRSLALGKFDALLHAASTHPAMGAFLGNAISTKYAPNENQGRELLELHTVGLGAGYSENDVKNSAKILTGWRVDLWDTWVAAYDPTVHWTGPVSVLDFSSANAASDGRAVTKSYLDHLARHPSTAERIARKLAVHFVSDNPSDALVQHLATVYLANDTSIAPVIKALVASPEFLASAGVKARTPEEDVIATYRALGVAVAKPAQDEAAANAMLWQSDQIGMTPFAWTRPDGRPDTGDAWSSVSRMLGSFDVHHTMSGGWWPTVGATYRTPAAWLPQPTLRFDQLVDHLSRRILGRSSTPRILAVATQATGVTAATVISASHDLVKWQMPQLLTVFLDNPQHIGR